MARQDTEYLVTVWYREPTYRRDVAATRSPYLWTFRVVARTDDSACRRAVAEFHRIARLSSVGWVREIVDVQAVPVRSAAREAQCGSGASRPAQG